MEYGLPYLKQKLLLLEPRIRMRYGYYDMRNLTFDFGISSPPELRNWNAVVGWCAKGVDAKADRIKFRKFKNDLFGLEQILNMNNRDVLLPALWRGALISACDFVYLSENEDGYPRMQAIDGGNATGILDTTTGMLTEGMLSWSVTNTSSRHWRRISRGTTPRIIRAGSWWTTGPTKRPSRAWCRLSTARTPRGPLVTVRSAGRA